MGDTGALVIGMMLSILAIHFIDVNYNLVEGQPYKFQASVATAGAFIVIPLMDTLRIIILRLKKRQSPFTPDKSHIHHAIMRLGMTHSQTTIILAGAHVLFIALAVAFFKISEGYLLPGFVLFSILLSVTLDWLILRRLSKKVSEEE